MFYVARAKAAFCILERFGRVAPDYQNEHCGQAAAPIVEVGIPFWPKRQIPNSSINYVILLQHIETDRCVQAVGMTDVPYVFESRRELEQTRKALATNPQPDLGATTDAMMGKTTAQLITGSSDARSGNSNPREEMLRRGSLRRRLPIPL